SMAALNGVLYMTLYDRDHGKELWRTDGTTTGTRLAVELEPGDGSGVYSVGSFLGSLWLRGPVAGLWRSDGTAAGTIRLTSKSTGLPTSALNGRAFFSVFDPL